MNENIEVLNVSNVKPIMESIEPEEIIDIDEEEWHNDAVINMSTMNKEKEDENFDLFFDNLSTSVEGANTIISEIIEQKKTIKDNEESITKERANFNLEKMEFEKYKKEQLDNIEFEKRRLADCVKSEKLKFKLLLSSSGIHI